MLVKPAFTTILVSCNVFSRIDKVQQPVCQYFSPIYIGNMFNYLSFIKIGVIVGTIKIDLLKIIDIFLLTSIWVQEMNNKQTILIIDDIEENVDILERHLIAADFDVLSANEGPKGLHILKEEDIDLVLLDINMPVVDGITLLGNIKEDKSIAHIPVIMVTANDDAKMVMTCLKKGACGYIAKPYSMEQIKQQIEHCFNP